MEDINSVRNSSAGLSVCQLCSQFAMNRWPCHLFYGKHCDVQRISYSQQALQAMAAALNRQYL